MAESLADERRLSRILSTMGYSFWMLGDPDRVVVSNRRALAIATSLGDFALEAAANFALGLAYHGLGEYHRASEPLNRNIVSLQGERMYGRFGTAGLTSVLSIMALAWCQAELGSFVEGIARGEEGVRIAQAVDHKLSLMFADVGVGQLYLVQGDLVRAIPTLERGLATCRAWDFPSWLPWLASRVGAAYVLAGRVADGLQLLEQSVEQAESMRWRADASALAARLSEAYLGAGRVQDASALAARALDLSVEHKGRGNQGWALRLLGEIASRCDRPDQAEGYYRQALVLAEELGMRPLVAHCHLGLGKLYSRTERPRDGGRALGDRDGDVSRDGHELLAGESGGGVGPAPQALTLNLAPGCPSRTSSGSIAASRRSISSSDAVTGGAAIASGGPAPLRGRAGRGAERRGARPHRAWPPRSSWPPSPPRWACPPVRVQVLAARPHARWGELHGLYEWERGRGEPPLITLWMRTAKQRAWWRSAPFSGPCSTRSGTTWTTRGSGSATPSTPRASTRGNRTSSTSSSPTETAA